MIITKALTKKYRDTTAVDSLELEIRRGELFSLLGVNGAGKTTTIKLLSCLTAPSSGDAFLGGHSVCSEPNEVKRIIAVSPQESAVAPNLSVRENLELICGVHGFARQRAKEMTDKMLAEFKLGEVEHKRASKLSGGWQRRLSIAMALISEPEILFLDEPTLGLDVLARAELWDIIRGLKGKTTVVLTTHYMEEAEALSDRVGIMADGRLIFCGTVEDIKTEAQTDRFEDAFIALVRRAGK